jgi:sugar phosphate isomerase/epimerase
VPLPLAVQLYTFRDPDRFGGSGLGLDVPTLTAIADAGFLGVETVDVPGGDPGEARRVLADLGLTVASAHTWTDVGDADAVARAADALVALGASRMIVSHDPLEEIGAVDALAERLAAAAEVARDHGLRLGYHNHDWELRPIGGVVPLDRIASVAGDALDLQVDIFWVVVGGAEPAEVIRRLGRQVVSLHLKDGVELPPSAYGAPSFINVPVGTGVVDPGPAVAAAEAQPTVEWLIVEFDHVDGSPLDGARASLEQLTARGLGRAAARAA